MREFPRRLQKRLEQREQDNALRRLSSQKTLIDFSSNDYLGFAKDQQLFEAAHRLLTSRSVLSNGATGSRLISGNHSLYQEVESDLCRYHNSESALIFNSGYDANIGFFSCILQRGDIIFYDELIHASIRDGITMSNAKAFKFKHNDLEDLLEKISRIDHTTKETGIYAVTESIFSMDGDRPDLVELTRLSQAHNVNLIIDEAHALGVFGFGLLQQLKLEHKVFARIATFGKALGCHGAAILGSKPLKTYLVNFSRSFIYTTGLPPHSLATIKSAYTLLSENSENTEKLSSNIQFFRKQAHILGLEQLFIPSDSSIHCAIISGNDRVKSISKKLENAGFDVKPILSPTVPKGEERIRFCIHSYNSEEEISHLLKLLASFVSP